MYSLNAFYNVDCLPAMRTMADKAFDLAIVDPPYAISADKEPWNQTLTNPRRKNDMIVSTEECGSVPTDEYFTELFRISKNQIIWGGNYFNLPPTRCVIAWDKMQPWDNFSAFELAWTSFDMPAAIYRQKVTSVVRNAEKIHPTQKPVALYRWLLHKFAHPGDTIIDTHAGSGSSIIACIEHGYDWMGFEINPKFYDAATQRIYECQRQARLAL